VVVQVVQVAVVLVAVPDRFDHWVVVVEATVGVFALVELD